MRSPRSLLLVIGALLQTPVGALHIPIIAENISYPFHDIHHPDGAPLARRADTLMDLRIMPLGASIVHGIGSEPELNGFRGYLRQALRFNGFQVDMVGSMQTGTIEDNDNEGTPGAIIDETENHFDNSRSLKPNVIVINLGTNDANRNIDVANGKTRMRNLLMHIWASDGMADACIMLSTLIPSGLAAGQQNNPILNKGYRELVTELQGQHCIYLADMDPADGPAHGWLAPDINPDGIHPNKVGHSKMAYVFWQAILRAYNDGNIKDPLPIDDSQPDPGQGCDKVYNSGSYAGLTQLGSGAEDGIYYHSQTSEGILLNHTSQYDQGQFFFAALYGRKYDDFLGWYNGSDLPYQNKFAVWKNSGGVFTRIADLDPDLHCLPRGIQFVDMNADGLDDIVCVDPDGNAYLSINQGDGTATKPPTFKRVSATAKIRDTVGFKQNRIRFADIDGDGRGDYLALDDHGNIQAWRNGWVDDIPKYWESLGTRFLAKGKDTIDGVRMLDINGDGRADWLFVDKTGGVETWTNSRTCQSGHNGDGLKVDWRQGFAAGASSGNTHPGVATASDGDIRKRILFGRVWGVPQDFGNFGRKDYVYLEHSLDGTTHTFRMRAWKSAGHGGSKVRADGVKYCNMLNHPNGEVDYVWTWSNGKMIMYPNAGKGTVEDGESYWGPVVTIFDPMALIGKNLDRRDLHLMDWDGDGDCDIVWTDPDNDNRPSVWLNLYHTTGSWSDAKTWDYFPNAQSSASGVSCAEKRGFNLHDHAVQFADLTGNGRDDYLCLRRDGYISAWLHNDDNSWSSVGQVKFSEGKDRANLRFADVNGDGKDDMIWVDKWFGDGYVYYNRGPGDRGANAGSYIHWDHVSKPVYNSDRAGTCVYFEDFDGNGVADIHVIRDVYSNKAATWLSPACSIKNNKGDGGTCCDDPHLPVQPGTSAGGPGGGGDGGNQCIKGHGPDDFDDLCAFACQYGFCPSPCVCDERGTPEPVPPMIRPPGVPASDKGREYSLLCAWSCARGKCPSGVCKASPGGVFAYNPYPEDNTDPNVIPTDCSFYGYAILEGCNVASWKEDKSYDPIAPKQDCSNPADAALPWKCACNNCGKAGNDLSLGPAERWNSVFAQQCMEDMTNWYWQETDAGRVDASQKSLPDVVGKNFGGLDGHCAFKSPPGFLCDVIGDSGCIPVRCGTTMYAAVDLVLNSFYNVFNVHNKMYHSLDKVAQDVTHAADTIHDTFSKANDATLLEILQTALDVFGGIFSIAGAGIWEKFLSAGVFKALTSGVDKGSQLQESINGAISIYKAAAGDAKTAKEKDMDDAKKIEDAAQVFADAAQEAIDGFMKFIYSAGYFGTAALQNLLSGGVFLDDPSAKYSELDFSDLFETCIYAQLIQLAWRLGSNQRPVVIYDKPNAKTPDKLEGVAIISDEDAAKVRYPGNYKASNGKEYSLFLFSFSEFPELADIELYPLKGHDDIDDEDNQWGVTWRDIVESSFSGFIAAGKKNPYPMAEPDSFGDAGSGNFFAHQEGVKSAGFASIPVCTVNLAFENYIHYAFSGGVCDEYPCCERTWSTETYYCKGLNEWCEPDGL
ncbi:hypothetical protein MKX07_008821 [Trichoderma sp. CBMAI-0711]|uniref:SGNH hydrolase-type esterase domain-containing protein n=1 Tax=Trichoderma parareesei TaxID=858221 RepID=A0A2H2ZXG8_TRIPA|nr:hypothetical protein MKX07_008821 [Trichoderma sp. CBMAI-0711]OTA03904.1 hypothetical protein A9Z42_0044640 [Trichoderma parareesei]